MIIWVNFQDKLAKAHKNKSYNITNTRILKCSILTLDKRLLNPQLIKSKVI